MAKTEAAFLPGMLLKYR